MPTTPIRQRGRSRFLTALLLCAVFCVSFALNMRGIGWARLAPDEHRIASWMSSLDDGEKIFIKNRVYPEGLFALVKVVRFFDREGEKISDRITGWQSQRSETAATPLQEELPRFNVVRIRRINAWLGAFATAFVFLTLLEIFGGPAMAAPGALLFAFHPLVVEHAHYAETDMMMVFMASFALWILTLAVKRASPAPFLGAAFIVGGAVASKFTLVPMLLLLPASAAVVARRSGRGAAGAAALFLAALAMAALGFFAFTPKLWYDPALYFAQWPRNKALAYAEIRGILGQAASRPGAAFAYKLRGIAGAVSRSGVAMLLAAAVSLPLWCARRFRPVVCALPLFGVMHLVVAPLAFPWFRSQEFLPAIPFFAASAVLPLHAAMGLRSRATRIAASVAALALLAAIAAHIVPAGARMSAAFASIETRLAASEWLDRSTPTGKTFLTEFYSISGTPSRYCRDGGNRVESAQKIEKVSPALWDEIDCDYFLRAENFFGRGNYDPFTGELFPDRRANLDHALSNARPIGRWSIVDGIDPTFAQSDIVLYANHCGAAPELDLAAFLPQPAIVKSKWSRNPDVRVPLNSGLLGPIKALHLLGVRTAVEFEPLPCGERWFAVAANHNRSGDVVVDWSGGFSPRKASVPAQGAALFVSDDSLSSRWKAVPGTRVRMRGDDHAGICTAFFTRSPVVAAGLLCLFGNDGAADALAVPVPSEAIRAAAGLLHGTDSASPGLFLNGIPSAVVRDFARIRIYSPPPFVVPDTPALAKFNDAYLYAKLPLAICGDRCTLRLVMKPSRYNVLFAGNAPLALENFHMVGAKLLSARAIGLDDDANLELELEIAGGRPYSPLFLGIRKPHDEATVLEAVSLTLEWDPAETLRRLAAGK